jgi:hypothetical protein
VNYANLGNPRIQIKITVDRQNVPDALADIVNIGIMVILVVAKVTDFNLAAATMQSKVDPKDSTG